MKKIVTIFPRVRLTSDGATNLTQNILLAPNLFSVLGSSYDMVWELTIYAVSGSNAQLTMNVFQGTKDDVRPLANGFSGKSLSGFPVTFNSTNIGINTITISGPYHGLIDAMMGVGPISGTTAEWMDVEVRGTLFPDR